MGIETNIPTKERNKQKEEETENKGNSSGSVC
jgi:hypothetical protein